MSFRWPKELKIIVRITQRGPSGSEPLIVCQPLSLKSRHKITTSNHRKGLIQSALLALSNKKAITPLQPLPKLLQEHYQDTGEIL